MRSAETFPTDEREISRLPREVIRCVHGVSDRAGSACVWPWRRTRSCLPHILTASAPRKASDSRPRAWISRLNTRPVPSPVNASPLSSRAAAHDSGPAWLALPSLFRTFTLSPRRLLPEHKRQSWTTTDCPNVVGAGRLADEVTADAVVEEHVPGVGRDDRVARGRPIVVRLRAATARHGTAWRAARIERSSDRGA